MMMLGFVHRSGAGSIAGGTQNPMPAMASHGFGPMDGEMSELFTLGQQSLRRIGRLKIMNVLQIRLAIKTVLRVHQNWICIR